ncbi:sugar ABC transporter substrate-binding protein [Actinomadura montaniterrae]|uniref:Sugar ABC transporter substrate-binding protein n=1 Tax=Actinomadura montaniterrae TaxID=1803903 RepID=A0A6L3W7S2_9ACTN|nr:sugar ABC transporter substrate-binding protein [Actinomadura montaniterrae]KAB2390364.1 sugar ABC transporter substrate-binding protein [Actinomadura montaniterrae]
MTVRARRTAAGLVAAGLLLGSAACGGGGKSGAAASGGDDGTGCNAAKGKTIGFSEPLPDPNFKAIEEILSKALAKYGAKLKAVNANLNPGKQISDLNTLMQQQVDALIANPVDPNATQGVFAQARAKKIPIIVLDTKVGGPYFTSVHDDVDFAGADGAKTLKSLVGGGKVAAMFGPAYAELLNWEKAGFEAGAKQAGLTVVDRQVNQKITPEDAKAIAESWRQKYGRDLKGIWTFNDVSAIGAASALGGGFAPAIVSINGQPDAVPLVEAGRITATYGVPYDKTGQALAYAALRAVCGGSVPKEIWIPTVKLDKKNIDDWQPIAQRVDNPFSLAFEQRDGKTYVKTS